MDQSRPDWVPQDVCSHRQGARVYHFHPSEPEINPAEAASLEDRIIAVFFTFIDMKIV